MIREVLQQLSKLERGQLMVAFNQELTQYIVLDDGHFVGVNVSFLKNLEVLEESGSWSYGRIR
jgi:hypothetical protein